MLEIVASSLAALVGAFIGAWASVRTVIDASRIKWIDTLREDVSEMLMISTHVRQQARYGKPEEERSNRLRQLDYKIRLMLSSKEDVHIRVHKLTNNFVQLTLDRGIDDGQFYELRQELFRSVRDLLKEEWDRVSKISHSLRRFYQRLSTGKSAH